MTADRKVLIMAGGTGGHIFPALSIARCLSARGIAVEWLGTRKGMEAGIVSRAGIPIHFISVSGLRGKSLLRKLVSPLVIAVATLQSLYRLLQIRPGCVLGMGGFVTGPGGVAAWLLRRRLCIHEQNAIAGFSNWLLMPLASTVMEGFPGAFARKHELTSNRLLRAMFNPGKIVDVGNPVREELLQCPSPQERFARDRVNGRPLRILVVGGSRGAVAINRIMPAVLASFAESGRPEVYHQCGRNNEADTREHYNMHGIEESGAVRVEEFITDMAAAYGWADIVVCRAGAITVSEIAAVGVAAIFVPFPFAVDDHQTENAAMLERLDAAWIIRQSELNAQRMASIIREFNDDRDRILAAALRARKAAREDAAERAAGLCMEADHGR